MNALESLDRVSRLWGDWMLHMAWQVALLVLILAALTRIWRRKSAVLLHTLWLLVLVRLVLPPSFAFPTGWAFWLLPAAGESRPLPGEAPRRITPTKSPVMPRDAASTIPSGAATPASRETEAASHAADPSDRAAPLVAEKDSAAEPQPSPEAAAPAEPALAAPPRAVRSWSSPLLLAWGGVAGTLLGLLFWGSVRVRRWVREAEPIDDPELYSLLEDCRERLMIRRLVELRNSEACTTPVVVGFRRPVILLPKEVLVRLNAAELRAVLMHELNHIARGDAIVNLLQGVLGALYFFHPLVWWASAALRRLREEACDELTVAALDGERRTYGEALIKVTEIFGYASPPLAIGILESNSPARSRLGRILDPHLPQGATLSWRTAAAVLLLAAVLLPGAGGRTSASPGRSDVARQSESGDQANKDGVSQPAANVAAVAVLPGSPPAAPPLEGKSPLRYRWQAGKSYAYTVVIEADEGETIELYSGTPVYVVRSTGAEGTELVFSGRLMPSQKFKPGQGIPFGRPPRFRSPFSSNFSGMGIQRFPAVEHVLHVDNRGRVESLQGESQLPYVLGNLSQLVLVPFPDEEQSRWEESEKTTITLRSGDERFPFPRSPFNPFANREEGERLEARERAEYERDEPVGNTVVIRKKYELKSTRTHDGRSRLELAGDARITFDPALGLPVSLSGQFQITHNTESSSQRIPITVSARLLSEDERARLEAEAKASARRTPLDNAALDAALVDLTAADPFRVQNAAGRLERAEPQGRRDEVARALEPL
ncbi:MAG: M56 family metallopeptidase, partial [Deltaproteobacteria bacterium]